MMMCCHCIYGYCTAKKMAKSNYQHKAYTYTKVQIKTKRYQNMNMECVRLTWFIQRMNVNCMMDEWRVVLGAACSDWMEPSTLVDASLKDVP